MQNQAEEQARAARCGVFAQIDLGRLRANYRYLAGRTAARLICVVKDNAYGHGLERVAAALFRAGADFFAVATVEEGVCLRRALRRSEQKGEDSPLRAPEILVLGACPPDCAADAAASSLTLTVHSAASAAQLSLALSQAVERGELPPDARLSLHAKLDTGMHRYGFDCRAEALDEAVCALRRVAEMPRLHLCGLYSHLASVEESPPETEEQLLCFRRAVRAIRCGVRRPLFTHISAGAALLGFGAAGCEGARAGLALYGYPPAETEAPLLPVLSLYARIGQILRLRAGDAVGYGGTFRAPRPMRIATVSLGYGQGLLRACRSGSLLWRDTPLPLVGRISMDSCAVAVGEGLPGAADCREGELVTVYDPAGRNLPSLAAAASTIPYELLVSIPASVRRFYADD